MGIAKVDSKNRISLGRDVIEDYGEKFVVVRLPSEILLKPLPKDPVKALMEEGKKLKGVSIKQFKKDVHDYMRERA